MPFGQECEFKDFKACVDKFTGKVEDPDAYCATLMRKTEAHCKGRNKVSLSRAAMQVLCPACAEHMDFLHMTALNVDGEELKTLLTRAPANVSQLCDKLGGDPGVFTACMEMVAGWELENKEGFCNWLHQQCTGKSPGEHALVQLEAEVREQELVALEAYRKGVAAAPMLYKPMGLLKAAPAPADGMMTFVASEETEDRLGDVIKADGWDLKEYQRNPVYLFQHDHSIPPIGSVPKVWVEGKQLLNMVKWDVEDPFAKFIQGKYQRGVMKGQSVGFRPIVFRQRTDGGKGMEFQKTELLEISAVAVPAHPAAVLRALGNRHFGIVMPSILKVGTVNNEDDLVPVVAGLHQAFR